MIEKGRLGQFRREIFRHRKTEGGEQAYRNTYSSARMKRTPKSQVPVVVTVVEVMK